MLWFHADSSNYSLAKVGVCYSNSVTGPYTCPEDGVFSPLGMESRDMNVYVDTSTTTRLPVVCYQQQRRYRHRTHVFGL